MKTAFWKVNVNASNPTNGGSSWERYFMYCPTVQQMRDIVTSEKRLTG